MTILNNQIKCLVLGGRGFIGSHLIDSLLMNGYSVRCFDRPYVISTADSHISNPNFELFEGDLISEADICEALLGCDVCFHFVSTTLPKSSNADPVFDVESNILGTLRLLNNAVKLGLKKIIFVSSGGTVYGVPEQVPILESHPTEPVCSYGITKLAIEKYLSLFKQLHGLDYTILRLSNPFGERQRINLSQGVVAVFLGKVLRGEPIEVWGDGSVIRDYIYISDVVDALVKAMLYRGEEHVFNIGSGFGFSINEVIDAIEKVTGRQSQRRYLASRVFDVPINILDINRAKKYLGWTPKVEFENGLLKFVDWLSRENFAD